MTQNQNEEFYLGFSFIELISWWRPFLFVCQDLKVQTAYFLKFKLGGKHHQVKYVPDESLVKEIGLGIQVWTLNK